MTTRPLIGLVVALAALACACSGSHETTDAAAVHDDAPPPTGMFGAPCSSNAECIDGYCVQPVGGVGGVCTRTCNNDCPADWTCRAVHVGDNPVELCIPNAPQLCLACAADTECGGGAACLQIDGSGRCATSCTTATDCPTGYTCVADASGTHAGSYCQPTDGSCTCTAAMAGGTRACTNTNPIGTCFGTQTCDPATGWSACTAPAAVSETCDGKDDDCDFLIDEDVGGGQACTNSNSFGTCAGTRTCGGSIGFTCEGQIPMAEKCNYADDDCDGSIDEGFTGLGTVCTPGVGACQRFGSIGCSADGSTTQCSVTAGSPTTELCNGIDDDCDGVVDNGFPGIGGLCSAGYGVCTRYGTTQCAPGGMTTMCSATPGTNASPETCNYLDDDCDNIVDNGYRNVLTGLYDTTANCGACGNDCTTIYTGANSTGTCSTSGGTAKCVMVCNVAGTYDLDNNAVDGCEFTLDNTVVYVSTSDTAAADDATCGLGPSGTQPGYHPCKTIGYGMTRAAGLGRANIDVADGTYNEAVTLATGKNLHGGYYPGTWQRHLITTGTVIQGVSSTGNHDLTVIAIGVTNAMFEGFNVRGSFDIKPSGNSYAIYVSGADSTLVIQNNQIFAGRGGPGMDGAPGNNGATGPNGTGSVNGSYDGYTEATSPCTVTRQYSNGAVASCGGDDVSGGNGGGNRCPPASDYSQYSAINGFAGQPGAGVTGGAAGGTSQGGYDGTLQVQGLNETCFLPGPPMTGNDGAGGGAGGNGGGVAGCSNAGGTVSGGHWVSGAAAMGKSGFDGGGGGGAAGGGGRCSGKGGCNKDRLGAHGGGGGAGGCGGTGGAAGASGGGAFGIFVVGGTAPTIRNNTIERGAGGSAGAGGIGGAGGLGGLGGVGGAQVELCAAKAGRGGDGGAGGSGSGGGGGCGGSSYGIFTSGVGTPTYCTINTVTGGAAGFGGSGGFSGGVSGGNGANGVLSDCTSM
ncbi:MAG: MopE-related protein [Acidobacteriota bacterium]